MSTWSRRTCSPTPGLNEFIPGEIAAADGSEEWGAFAEADIYASDGELYRAMRVLKKAIPFYASAPIETIPLGYWKILFPQPYWAAIEQVQPGTDWIRTWWLRSSVRSQSSTPGRSVVRTPGA